MKKIDETNNIDKIEKVNENIDNTKEENVENKEINKEAEKEVNKKKKSNFVPAYERKKIEMEQKVTTEKKVSKTNKTKSKTSTKKDKNTSEAKKEKDNKPKAIKSKITVILIALVVVVIVAISLSLVYLFNNENIEDYNRLMDDYGLSMLYNNQTSNSSDKITKSEAIKLVIGSTLKTEDITSYMPDDMLYKTNKITQTTNEEVSIFDRFNQTSEKEKIEEEYINEYWVRYAKSIEFIRNDEITIDNYNEEVTYLEFIQYISKAKTVLLGKKLDIEKEPNFKNYNEYNNETKWMLADLVYNGILEDKNSKFDGDKIATKEFTNTLIINHVLKYNLITINDEKININELKMPSNKDEFAYTLSNVNKKVYEIENYKANENYKNARQVYATLKNSYEDLNSLVEMYYNTLLNIDYTTITPESLYAILVQSTMYMVTEEDVEKYVEYVKTNQIQITGEAKVQNPIIYFDGEYYRVRTKLTYDLKNAIDYENVLFKDTDTKYKLGKGEKYIDVPLYQNITKTTYYIIPTTISNIIAGSVK